MTIPKLPLLAALGCAVVCGCAVTRQGTITGRPDGRSIQITVRVEGDAAEIDGVDNQSGERFRGRLLVDDERRQPAPGSSPPVPPMGSGSGGLGGGPAPVQGAATMSLVGTVEGDRGTRLRCAVEVKQRLRLTGEGVCREIGGGEGATYVIVF